MARKHLLQATVGLVLGSVPVLALAQALPALTTVPAANGGTTYSLTIQTLLLLTMLSFVPAMVLMMTSFTRIIIVFSLLRQAMGTQTSPPNQVLLGLALFLTFFIMAPVADRVYTDAYVPMSEGTIGFEQALERASVPVKTFMLKQVREPDPVCRPCQGSPGGEGRRPADAGRDTGLRHLGAENSFSDRLHRLHSVHHHRHGGRFGADVDGYDDDVPGDRLPALQDHALRPGRRLDPAHRIAGSEFRSVGAQA
jgi:hypothetical protein